MSETLVERMARALCRSDANNPDTLTYPGGSPMWTAYVPKALAAFRAIREPTEGMIEAGSEWAYLGQTVYAVRCFTTMIDAAITEAGHKP